MNNRWAILIGINGYHESLGPLNFCVNDARLMHDTLASECCGFPADNIIQLTDDQPKERLPTFGNIHSWLGTWLSRAGPDDLVLVYFAGHGREANGQVLLAPLDATLDSLPVTGVPVPYVRDLLDRCPAEQKVLILDACHSGAGRDVATMTAGFREVLDAGRGLYTIASCDADQISYEWPEKQAGLFTHYLVEGIRHGAPVESDGRVNLDSVYDWTRNGILTWTSGKRLRQEPVRICRSQGAIYIASRSLSLEQQLAAARAQVNAHGETIRQLRADLRRLAEENQAIREKSKREAKKSIARQGPHTKRIVLKDWMEWVGGRGPYNAEVIGPWILSCCLIGGLGGGVGGGAFFGQVLNVSDALSWFIGIVGGLALGPGLAFLGWLMMFNAWQNKYRLYCLQECIKGGDTLGAAGYTGSLGRFGIDLGTGAAAVCAAAELAADNGELDEAKALYRQASTVWKSRHAARALVQLERDSVNGT